MNTTATFPTCHLPAVWADWIDTSSARLGVPADHLAVGLLAALAAATGGRIVARPLPDWTETLDLRLCQVGGPRTGKSRALDAAAALLPADEGPSWRADGPDDGPAWLRKRTSAPVAGPVVGGLRPGELAGALKDGRLAARVLFFWPERPAWRPLTARASAAETANGTALLTRLAALAPEGTTLALPFDPEALALFDAFSARLYDETGEDEGPLSAWLARGPNAVAALSLAIVLLDWCASGDEKTPGAIAAGAVTRAIALYDDYFRPQAERALERSAEGRRLAPVERVLRWLGESGKESVSQEEVRRFGLNQSLDAAAAGRVIAELETRGVLVALPEPEGRGRGRPSPRWSVHLVSVGKSENRKIAADEEPTQRRGTVVFDMPEIERAEDLQPALAALARQAAAGKLTPQECQRMSAVVKLHMDVFEMVELAARLKELEDTVERDQKLYRAFEGLKAHDAPVTPSALTSS